MNRADRKGYDQGSDYLLEEDLDLRKYFRILYRNKWKIILTSLFFGAVTAAILLLPDPRYQATATLSFETGQANLVEIEKVYEENSKNRGYLKTQEELIRSRRVIDRVIDQLNLIDTDEFYFPDKFELTPQVHVESSAATTDTALDSKRDLLAVQFQRRLKVEHIRNTQLIKITFEAGNRDLAARIVNTIAEVYIQTQREAEEEVTQRAASWLSDHLETARRKLEESEKALREFTRQEMLVDIEGILSLSAKEVNETTAQLMDARRHRQEIENIRDLVHQRGTNIHEIMALPTIRDQAEVQNLKRTESAVEQRRLELSLRYGPKHPKMVTVDNELKFIRKQLFETVEQWKDRVEGDYQVALNSERRLREEIDRLKRDYQEVYEQESQYSELKRNVEIDRGLYNTFLTRVKETEDVGSFDAPPARLADPAVPPQTPVKVKLELFVAIALVGGMVLGSVSVLLFEMFYDVVRSPEDIESTLGQNLFGVIPSLRRASDNKISLRAYFERDNYSFSEAVRTLRTSLVLSHIGQSAKIIVITSSVPGEGKTTVSQSLAFSLAQMEKVLLIDADLRRPTVGRSFGFGPKRPGLTNLLMGRRKAEECIYRDRESGIDVMPSGPIPPDAQKLLGSVAFANHIKLLAARYDRIVIDTPPVQAVSDALMISRHAQSIIYVIKSHATRKRVIQKGIDRFVHVGAEIDGVVLSQVDPGSSLEYSSEYYGYCGDKYGSGAPDMEAFDIDYKHVADNGGSASKLKPELSRLRIEEVAKREMA